MDGHVDAGFLGDRDDLLQEIAQVLPEVLLGDLGVVVKKGFQPLLGVARVPAGKAQLAGEGVHLLELVLVVDQGVGAVGEDLVELSAGPVKDGHKVVADALDARFAQAADILLVIFDVAVAGGLAQLDVLVDGDALDDLKVQPRVLGDLFEVRDALPAPELPGRDVVDGGYDAVHVGDLADVLDFHRVVRAIPAE